MALSLAVPSLTVEAGRLSVRGLPGARGLVLVGGELPEALQGGTLSARLEGASLGLLPREVVPFRLDAASAAAPRSESSSPTQTSPRSTAPSSDTPEAWVAIRATPASGTAGTGAATGRALPGRGTEATVAMAARADAAATERRGPAAG